MIYTYKCSCMPDAWDQFVRSIHEGPPALVICQLCGSEMQRDWKNDLPMIETSSCRDPDDIPEVHRVQRPSRPRSAAAEEAKFRRHVEARRRDVAEGNKRSSFRQSHAVPADLYHGKIKQTGDRDYWRDPKNLQKHSSCKVTK